MRFGSIPKKDFSNSFSLERYPASSAWPIVMNFITTNTREKLRARFWYSLLILYYYGGRELFIFMKFIFLSLQWSKGTELGFFHNHIRQHCLSTNFYFIRFQSVVLICSSTISYCILLITLALYFDQCWLLPKIAKSLFKWKMDFRDKPWDNKFCL